MSWPILLQSQTIQSQIYSRYCIHDRRDDFFISGRATIGVSWKIPFLNAKQAITTRMNYSYFVFSHQLACRLHWSDLYGVAVAIVVSFSALCNIDEIGTYICSKINLKYIHSNTICIIFKIMYWTYFRIHR